MGRVTLLAPSMIALLLVRKSSRRSAQRGLAVAMLDEMPVESSQQVLLGGTAIPDGALLEDEVPQPRCNGRLESGLEGDHSVTSGSSNAAARRPSRSTLV